MTTIQHRVRLVDHRGPSGRRVEIAPGGGDEDLVILEARRPRFNDTPVEVQLLLPRKDLLAALGAEPDETDYREVVEENDRLGRKLAEAISARDDARKALRGVAEAPEEPRADQDQVDRSWALERAGEVVGRLAAVGVHLSDSEAALWWAAEWIVNGTRGDRG